MKRKLVVNVFFAFFFAGCGIVGALYSLGVSEKLNEIRNPLFTPDDSIPIIYLLSVPCGALLGISTGLALLLALKRKVMHSANMAFIGSIPVLIFVGIWMSIVVGANSISLIDLRRGYFFDICSLPLRWSICLLVYGFVAEKEARSRHLTVP